MNSVPNSDCKQCTESKLGWVHCAHTQNPGGAHTARAVPMLWALLRAQQACRAHVARTASSGRAHAGRALVATRPGNLPPGCDLTSMSRPQSVSLHHPGHSMSQHQIGVVTPPRLLHVATSFLLPSPSQVVTSRPGRELPGDEPMS